jgi:hypothetical protein
MAERTPNDPRPRALIALAVLSAAALFGIAAFTRSEAAATPATDRSGWYDVVRESVKILMECR